jgi:ElaB/YqjD/DUF883 family membrane-anchored ribosome-binding protein
MTADVPGDSAPADPPSDVAYDDAFTRLEKEMIAVKGAIGGVSDQIDDAATDIGAVAQDEAKQGLKHVSSHVDSIVAEASGRAGAVAKTARMEASSLGDTLEDVIRERPLPMAAIALGLGFLVGVAWRR